MAAGDFVIFDQFWEELGKGTHNLSSNTLKLGIVDDTITPARDDTTPTWGDYSTNEVSGTNYTTGGLTLTTKTWAQTDGVAVLDSDNFTVSYSASGFNDGYWGILYDDGATSDEAIGYINLGGPVGNDSEDLQINVPTIGWVTLQRKVA